MQEIGVQLGGQARTHLTALEEELGVPIRLVDCGGRTIVPDQEASRELSDQGIGAFQISEGSYPWEPGNHPEGARDFANGVTLAVRSLPQQPRAVAPGNEVPGYARGGGERGQVAARIHDLGEVWYIPERQRDPQTGNRLDAIQDPTRWWVHVEPHHFPDSEMVLAQIGMLEEVGRVITYPFLVTRVGTRTMAYDLMYSGPIKALVEATNTDEFRERMMRQARERFVEFAKGQLDSRIADVRRAVSTAEAMAREAEEMHATAMNRGREERMTLDSLMAQKDGEAQGIDPEKEWEALQAHDKIERIRLSGDRVTIETTELEITDPETGDTAPLGKFSLNLPLRPGTGRGVQMTNLTNAKDPGEGMAKRHHPHIENGRPCFGSLMNEVARLSAVGEISGMVETLLHFLQTYNRADDWGRFAGLWFEGNVRGRDDVQAARDRGGVPGQVDPGDVEIPEGDLEDLMADDEEPV